MQNLGHSYNTSHNQTHFEGHAEEGLLHSGLFGSALVHFPETYTQEAKSTRDKKKAENEVIIFSTSLVSKGPQDGHILRLSHHLQIVKTKVPPATAAPRGVGQRF